VATKEEEEDAVDDGVAVGPTLAPLETELTEDPYGSVDELDTVERSTW
jgi:hypothetical protein